MKKLKKMVVVLALALLAGGAGSAQKKNKRYQPGALAQVAGEGVVVDDVGITPQSLTRPDGAFLLAIANRRGNQAEHFSLTLDKDGAPEILSLDTTAKDWRVSALVDLEPGKYRLRLTRSPELSMAIE